MPARLELKLKRLLEFLGLSQRQLAKHLKMSSATVNLIVNYDEWPRGHVNNRHKIAPRILAFLEHHGAKPDEIETALDRLVPVANPNEGEHQQRCTATDAPDSPGQQANYEQEEILMLLRHQTLTQAARQHFRILRDPFVDELRGGDDVFITEDIRHVRAAMRSTAQHGGMLAVVGESGSGKSTLRHDLADWIASSGENITVIEPYVIGMSSDTTKSHLRAADITGAVIRQLAPSQKLRLSLQDRAAQMHKVLQASSQVGNKHVLIIEEAHDLAIPTLKHLKRFYELQDGFKKLLAIVLIGQTELGKKLSEHNPEVREVVQRCEKVTLLPLHVHVESYLRHKFARIDSDYEKLMAPNAAEAVREALRINVTETHKGQHRAFERSLCYPLAINNLVTRAMNNAVLIGSPKVDAALIKAAMRSDSYA